MVNLMHFPMWLMPVPDFLEIDFAAGPLPPHQELLRGMMNGCPLTSCDLTSPDATTLVRQYQSAVFTPIMRVHEMQGTPRMPWFWPGARSKGFTPERFDETQRAFQAALGLRYTFLPFMSP